MKSTIRLRFLGTIEVARGEEPVNGFRSRKALALLGYLAVQDQPVPRERLAELFWEGRPEARGRANLTWVLGRIKRVAPGCVRADRHTLRLERGDSHWLDVDAFEVLRERGDTASLAGAAELYRGEFLEGVSLAGCAEFELWLVGERERWRQRTVDVLRELMTHHGQRGEYEEGLGYGRRLLGLEPWHEEAHRRVMRLLGWSGQRTAALAQYEVCCRVLEGELGAEPTEETVRLYEQIRDGELEVPVVMRLPGFGEARGMFLGGESAAQPVFAAWEEELGRVVFVTGEAGQGNAHTGVGDPYLPFREVPGSLAGDVEGQVEAGIALMQRAIAITQASGCKETRTMRLNTLTEAYGENGQIEEAFALLDEVLAFVLSNAECIYEAEAYRVKGQLLLMQGEEAEAEACFQHAIGLADELSAKLWRLWATVSLCCLWKKQERQAEARERMARIYGWFSEGSDAPDLQTARVLLEELKGVEARD